MKNSFLPFCVLSLVIVSSLQAQELKKLGDAPLSGFQKNLLQQVKTSPFPQWMTLAPRLAEKPNRALFTSLETLALSDREEMRKRAGYVLMMMKTKESLEGVLRLALHDKSKSLRITLSSYLASEDMPGLLKVAGLVEEAKKGLIDKNADARFSFALILAKAGERAAIPVLKKALSNRDHHFRQSAAESLAELGDDSGAGILIKMLSYSDRNHPLLKANKSMKKNKAAWDNLLKIVRDERVRVCGHLGDLKVKKALPILKKTAASKDPEVSEAAKKALRDIESSQEGSRDPV